MLRYLLSLCFLPGLLHAAPGDILFTDDFERATLAPNWTTDVPASSAIDTSTSNSGTRSMYTGETAVQTTSSVIDLTAFGADLSLWVRRGADAFSEDPDDNENLTVEFLDSVGTWVNIATYPGNGTAGEIITDTIPLPFSALHANFQLRISQSGGSGANWDFWHVDDVIITETAASRPPLALGVCDDFEQGLSNWSTVSAGGQSGINTATFQSSTSSMYTNGGTVTVTSNVIDTNTTQFDGVSMWIRRGSDTFSEDPDGGEDLVVEYLNNALTWVGLETFLGNGTAGQIYTRTYNLPATAQHNNFQLRFRQTGGNAGIYDFWHVDDVCIDGTVAFPAMVVYKSVDVEDDPVNNTSNPKVIPLANSVYTIRVVNAGVGSPDTGFVIREDIPPELEMFTGNFSGGAPYDFTDGPAPDASNVSCNFVTLGNGGDCITFLNGSDNPITPNGTYDPAVRAIEFRPAGTMNPSTGANTPYFDLDFRLRVISP